MLGAILPRKSTCPFMGLSNRQSDLQCTKPRSVQIQCTEVQPKGKYLGERTDIYGVSAIGQLLQNVILT